MASIKKRSDGTWQATIYCGRDENGKKINKYVTKHSEKEVKKAARELEQELEDGKLSNVDNIRVAEWIKSWLEIHKNQYSPSTYVLYLGYLKNHYRPFFKQMKFKELKEIHLKKLLNELLGKMSQTSARRVMSCLRPILHDAMKNKSPMRDIKLPKEDKVDYSDVPTPEKFKAIHNAVRGTRDEPIILLAGWCGLRREEIFALRPNDLDFANNTIRIDEAYVINDQGKYQIKSTKSENGLRDVAAPPYLMDLLKVVIRDGFALKKRERKIIDINDKNIKNDQLMFPMRPDSYTSYLGKLVRDKKIPKTRLHFLRHYHATWLYENDVLDHLAAERLGHDIKV
ncbi:site-specific integrase [Desulfosporosinus sp. BG]|uniref:site-specific integrase n=1 Tax=Desulfosporosinus sp. BG TaxID=1633135 RepID=UPI0008565103|nr:site-specific integrase [Desulfosporosinus sp. BG]ODA39982.1 site-specific recombinase, phage integrase family [Desulfosporosinus sp. BG]